MTHTPLRTATVVDTVPETEQRKRRRWPWLAMGGVVVALALGATAYAMNRDAGTEPTPEPAASGAEGALSATVTGTRCQVASVGPDDLTQRAAGEFCLVEVRVKNTGPEPLLLDQGAQRAFDDKGAAHPVAEAAAAFLNDGQPSLLDEIQPGAEVNGVLPFDVPRGTGLATLELHESVSSPGSRIPLR